MRIPYTPNPPPTSSATDASIVERIQARRAPRPLQPLDLALLHSPPVADGWNSFLGAVRTKTTLPDDLRELAIARVAAVNKAWYEWMHHAPLAVQAGVEDRVMQQVVRDDAEMRLDEWKGQDEGWPAGLTEKQWVVLVMADEMTRNVKVEDRTFEKARSMFTEREIVEIVATVRLVHMPRTRERLLTSMMLQIACYNCVSRFLVALDGRTSAFLRTFMAVR
jgi:alkylhydroperoxidase family enzyme